MQNRMKSMSINRKRRAGVLLHPTSLPGQLNNGDIGHQAYRFIEFLHTSGFKVWQMLPLGPPHDDKSPYQCLSSHAGNPLLISLDWLVDKGWLDLNLIKLPEDNNNYRFACLKYAARSFYQMSSAIWINELSEFTQKHASWLDDYALFMALKGQHDNKPWYEWPGNIRHRDEVSLNEARQLLTDVVEQIIFEQFIFFRQWHEIRVYAKRHQIELFGDMPIFVARDSADVWAQRDNFLIDKDGNMPVVAGVPPDAFSETGQRWGNPLYDWEYMQSTDFSWWKERFETQLELFDIIRIDHFRGLQACWEIPEANDTAVNGSWVDVPGKNMLDTLFDFFDYLPLVAEDLGIITDAVIELKHRYDLPGMKVLQFAFDGNNSNPHMPHLHEKGDLIYTGTHDNDTTLGWISNKENYNKNWLEEYLDVETDLVDKAFFSIIRSAMASVSFLCMLPMQDILMLGTSARMNLPGTIGGNWEWRFDWKDVNQDKVKKIEHLMMLYQR